MCVCLCAYIRKGMAEQWKRGMVTGQKLLRAIKDRML